jgi:hypothetical protein
MEYQMIKTAVYAVPMITAILFFCLAAVRHAASVRKAIRAKNAEEGTIRSAAVWVSVYSMMAFVSVAMRLLFPDVRENGAAICLIAAGLPFSIAWGLGVYRSVKHAHNLLKPNQDKP